MSRRGNIYNKDETTVIKENVVKSKYEDKNIITNDDVNRLLENKEPKQETVTDDVNIEPSGSVDKENEGNNNEKQKKNNNKQVKQIVFLVIFIIIAISLTATKLAFKYNELNKQNATNNGSITNNGESTNYGITDYKDMYYINPLEIKEEEYYKERSSGKYRTEINYVTISGLKDKELQTKINKEIKDAAYKYYDNIGAKEDYLVYTYVGANFSNVLSININVLMWDNVKLEYRIDETIALNYNLLTGEKLIFTDVFAANTPMNYIIYQMAYEALAWDTEIDFDADEIEWDKHTNMDNRDTSEYEDIILKNIRDFESIKKEEVEFYITSSRIYVKLRLGNDDEAYFVGIPSYKYAEYINIYKKLLVNNTKLSDIYETMPSKKSLVFTDSIGVEPYYSDHISDNLYLSLTILDSEEYDEETYESYPESTIILKDELLEKNVVEITNNAKALARENEKYGYIVRAMIDSYISTYENDFGKEDYIELYVDVVIDRASINYYNKSAFKALAARVLSPKVDVWGAVLGELDDKNITRLEKEGSSEQYYYDITGKLIAKSWNELEKYMDNKYKEIVVEESSQTIEDVNIYRE